MKKILLGFIGIIILLFSCRKGQEFSNCGCVDNSVEPDSTNTWVGQSRYEQNCQEGVLCGEGEDFQNLDY